MINKKLFFFKFYLDQISRAPGLNYLESAFLKNCAIFCNFYLFLLNDFDYIETKFSLKSFSPKKYNVNCTKNFLFTT